MIEAEWGVVNFGIDIIPEGICLTGDGAQIVCTWEELLSAEDFETKDALESVAAGLEKVAAMYRERAKSFPKEVRDPALEETMAQAFNALTRA